MKAFTILHAGITIGLLSTAALCPAQSPAALRVAKVFGDHMVLQREKTVPIWGWATPAGQVKVQFAGQTKTAQADTAGKWMVKLDPMPANAAPQELVIEAGNEKSTITDVLVGEVWLASGQSNMGWPLQKATGGQEAIANCNDPLLRMAGVKLATAAEPLADLPNLKWNPSSPETAATFSAVAYFFARDLRKSLGVPVGIIKSAYASSTCQAWIPMETMKASPEFMEYVTKWEQRIADFDAGKLPTKRREAKAGPARPGADDPRNMPMRPVALYNAMIAPLTPAAIRGVIWYQAEGNNGDPLLEKLFPAMIGAWRQRFENPELPFLFVQLPNFKEFKPEIRELQARCAKNIPNTAMVVTIDVGETDQIHPQNKEPVGVRLALKARALVYGEKIEHSGPVPVGQEKRGNSLVVKFSHAEGGLVAQGGELKGFEIAGESGEYFPAQAALEGESVALNSSQVPSPKKVRYAWTALPEATLFNKAGLPAGPFRTDAL